VMFAAITVVIALLGLLLLGLSFMHGVALGAATAVLATMLAALTIIPALIGGSGGFMDGVLREFDARGGFRFWGTRGRLAVRVAAAMRADRDFTFVAPPALSPDGRVATITAYPRTGPQDKATTETLKRVRGRVLPPVERATRARVEVGGFTASTEDFSRVVAGKLPLFVGVVVLFSALLLLAVFRSVVIPVKAAVMNLLSIGAALGFVTLVFQEGHGAGLLGIGTGPIESFVPVL